MWKLTLMYIIFIRVKEQIFIILPRILLVIMLVIFIKGQHQNLGNNVI